MKKFFMRPIAVLALLAVLLVSLVPSALANSETQTGNGRISISCKYERYALSANDQDGQRDENITRTLNDTEKKKNTVRTITLKVHNLQDVLESLANGVYTDEWTNQSGKWKSTEYVINMDAPVSIKLENISTEKYASIVNEINKKVVFTGEQQEAEIAAVDEEDVIKIYNGSSEGITISSYSTDSTHPVLDNPPADNKIIFSKGLEVTGGAVVNFETNGLPNNLSTTHRLTIEVGDQSNANSELNVNSGTLNINGLETYLGTNYEDKEGYSWLSSMYLVLNNGASVKIGENGAVTLSGAQVENADITVASSGTLTVKDADGSANKKVPSNVTAVNGSPAVKCEKGSSLTITGNSAVKSTGTKAVELEPGAKVTTDAVKDLTVAEDMEEAYVDNAGNVIQKADKNDLPAFMEPTEAKGTLASGVEDTGNKLQEAAGNVGAELPTDAQTAAAHEWAHDKADEAKEALDSADEDVNIYVLTTVKTEVENFIADTAMTLDITPYYEVIATTADKKDDIHLEGESGQEKNAVLLSEKELVVNEPVQMTIPIPDTLYSTGGVGEKTPSFVVLHKHNGNVYLYHATYSSTGSGGLGAHITFTNEHGFSEFTVIVVRQGNLSNLTASDGTMETFDPSKAVKSYTVNVPYSVSNLTLTATAAVKGDTVTAKMGDSDLEPVKDTTVADKDVYTISVSDLEVGKNTVTITVTHGSGDPTTYTVTIVRAAYVPPAYSVKAEAAENAEVKLSATSAAAGSKVTVTVTAGENYHVSGLTVTGANGKTVDVTDNEDGTYTFTMPASNVTVAAEVYECPSLAFPDIDLTEWYHEYVDYAIAHNLMRGIDVGVFAPEKTVTRAEMAGILWNLEGQPVVDYENPFPDVPANEWYTEAIRWAASVEVVSGCGDGTFKPEENINREQMAAMLYFYEQKIGSGGFAADETFELTFDDASAVSDWAREAVAWCTMKGVITGSENKFNPANTAKRSDLATILSLYDQLAK